MKIKLPMLLCAACLALSLTALAAGAPFADVPAGAWYEKAVTEAAEKGLMNGVSQAVFAPLAPVTRATVLEVFWRLEGAPQVSVSAPFLDAAGTWYDLAAQWGKGKGIATGYPDGRLGGDDAVTREQLAMFLYRYAAMKGSPLAQGMLGSYPDGDRVSPWAAVGMAHAVGAGLIYGTSENALNPQGVATRAELATMLRRLATPVSG